MARFLIIFLIILTAATAYLAWRPEFFLRAREMRPIHLYNLSLVVGLSWLISSFILKVAIVIKNKPVFLDEKRWALVGSIMFGLWLAFIMISWNLEVETTAQFSLLSYFAFTLTLLAWSLVDIIIGSLALAAFSGLSKN